MNRFHCHCGRFVGNIKATIVGIDDRIIKVTGVCKKHGVVDITDQDWTYEDFFPEEEDQND